MNILALSGFVPEQICDTVRFFGYPGSRAVSHYCGYAADFVSQVLDDPAIDGCCFPRTCDSCRVAGSLLSGTRKFVHRLHVPARRDRASVLYLAACIREYQGAVESHYGVRITDVPERAEMVNRRNEELAKAYDALPDISYGGYLGMVHRLLQTPLREQKVPGDFPSCGRGKPVFLVGSTVAGVELLSGIERAGMNIVGDRLTESKRLFSAPPVKLVSGQDAHEGIAESMLGNAVSPTQDDYQPMLREDGEEIRRKGVRGVIFLTQKYCEPYDYLFPAYKKMLDGMGIPALRISLAGSTDTRRFDTVVETFAEIL